MRVISPVLAIVGVLAISFPAFGCDTVTGERQQHVVLTWNGQKVATWAANLGDTKKVALPNGLEMGVRLDEPGPEYYRRLVGRDEYTWEAVKISIYDLSRPDPELLTQTYGNPNSLQGYGGPGWSSPRRGAWRPWHLAHTAKTDLPEIEHCHAKRVMSNKSLKYLPALSGVHRTRLRAPLS